MFSRFLVLAYAGILICSGRARAADDDPVAEAVAALQRGDLSGAERILRAELERRPADVTAQGVLGVVLDQEKKFAEADAVYRRALAAAPHSAPLLNNFGNHLLTTGKLAEARKVFLEVLSLNPGQANANMQLATIALRQKSPAEALRYLDRLPKEAQEAPAVAILTGTALSARGQYAQAETFFERAVAAQPDNFEALYDLGLAASHAGHKERARDVLQKALEKRPGNIDVQYDLAAVNVELNRKDVALELVARAAQQAPERADIQALMAHISADLGYFGDAAQAWERYMKLRPGDDTGRRERGFAEAGLGEKPDAGLADLRWFVAKHPNDATGHYELGVAESAGNPEEAGRELNRALALKPDLGAARFARGLLNYRRGKPDLALADFEFAARREPQNPAVLNRLGETYIALNRPADAVRVLRIAAERAPDDATILLHFGRALSKTNQTAEASTVFARVRELGPGKSELPHPAGLIDFLSLSPAEQRVRYRAGVERTVKANPDNVQAQIRYLELLLDDGKLDEAAATSRKILSLKPSPAILAEGEKILRKAQQYELAKQFRDQNLAPQ
ncbi:MAG TPA: tetratricopeptide repeat protein [Bryobacteraceae bacterium]